MTNMDNDVLMYVLYHNDYSKAYAQLHYGSHPWTRLYKVETQKYFESEFIVNILPTLRDEWMGKKYVGVMSWKANKKVPIHYPVIEDRIQSNADIVVMGMVKPPNKSGYLLKWAEECHPNFRELWSKLASHLGYDETDYLCDHIPVFYYNYWIMRTEVLEDYLQVAKQAYQFLEDEPSIQEKLHEDSEYVLEDGPRENMPYLTYHCFLMERLPCLYAFVKKWKVLPTYIQT